MRAGSKKSKKSRRANRKITLIPALLVKSEREFRDKLKKVERYFPIVQIDIMDGRFVPYRSWADPKLIVKIPTHAQYELHLMVRDPLSHLARWANVRAVRRVIFHIESVRNTKTLCDILCEAYYRGWEVGIAVNPGTSLDRVRFFIEDIDTLLIMGVKPGKSGQKLMPKTLEKIREAARLYDIPIAVDGGVTEKTIPALARAGADRVASASMVFSSPRIPALKKSLGL